VGGQGDHSRSWGVCFSAHRGLVGVRCWRRWGCRAGHPLCSKKATKADNFWPKEEATFYQIILGGSSSPHWGGLRRYWRQGSWHKHKTVDAIRAAVPAGAGKCVEGSMWSADLDRATVSKIWQGEWALGEPATSKCDCARYRSNSGS